MKWSRERYDADTTHYYKGDLTLYVFRDEKLRGWRWFLHRGDECLASAGFNEVTAQYKVCKTMREAKEAGFAAGERVLTGGVP